MKKIALVVLLCFVLQIALLKAYSQEEGMFISLTVDINQISKVVTIEGKVAAESDKYIALAIYRPGEVSFENLVDIYDVAPGSDGSFSYIYLLEDNAVPQQEYTVKASYGGVVATRTFVYYDLQKLNEILLAILNASKDELLPILEENAQFIGIDLSANSAFKKLPETYRLRVLEKLANENFTDIEHIKQSFNLEVANQSVIYDFNQSDTAAKVESAINKNGRLIGLDPDGILEKIEDRSPVYKGMIGTYDSIPAILSRFKNVAYAALVTQTPWHRMEEVLSEYQAVLQINLSGQYASLNTAQKTYLHKKMDERSFSSISEINAAFSAILRDALLVGTPKPQSSGGGGVSFGRASNIEVLEPTPVTQDKLIPRFDDIDHVPWAVESILHLYGMGVVIGDGNNKFFPDNNVTREEFIKMAVVAFGLTKENASCDFADVDKSKWYYPYISSAVNLGVIFGINNDEFGTGREISRQDTAVILYRIAEILGIDLPKRVDGVSFADEADIDDYARSPVSLLQQAGVINGVGDNMFLPGKSLTRAMAAKVIYALQGLSE